MKCEEDKTYDKPGDCPVCSMKLVAVENNSGSHESENQLEIATVDPASSMMSIENKQLAGIAIEIKEKPGRVIASL